MVATFLSYNFSLLPELLSRSFITMVNAIVTLLFTSTYLPGALVLGKSLRQLGIPSDTKLVVLLAGSLTEFELDQLSVSTEHSFLIRYTIY